MMIRVGIVGATGYTAVELLKLLQRHPHVEVTALTSRDTTKPHLSEVHPSLRDQFDLHLEPFRNRHVCRKSRLCFLLPATRGFRRNCQPIAEPFHQSHRLQCRLSPQRCSDVLKTGMASNTPIPTESAKSPTESPNCFAINSKQRR